MAEWMTAAVAVATLLIQVYELRERGRTDDRKKGATRLKMKIKIKRRKRQQLAA